MLDKCSTLKKASLPHRSYQHSSIMAHAPQRRPATKEVTPPMWSNCITFGNIYEDTSSDESSDNGPYQKQALPVEEPTDSRCMDLDAPSADGHEYVLKCRLLTRSFFRNKKKTAKRQLREQKEYGHLMSRARKEADKFKQIAIHKDCEVFLRKKFHKLDFPKIDSSSILEWCIFCLGSKICAQIYRSYKEPRKEIEGHPPLLSIIVHFNDSAAFTVLKHLHYWFQTIGMEESLASWIFAVLARIRKPLDESTRDLLESMHKNCKIRLLRSCDELQRYRLYLISEILSVHFSLNADDYF